MISPKCIANMVLKVFLTYKKPTVFIAKIIYIAIGTI